MKYFVNHSYVIDTNDIKWYKSIALSKLHKINVVQKLHND